MHPTPLQPPAAQPLQTLAQRPQDRANALIATAQSVAVARARESGCTLAEFALKVAQIEAANLRGYVHSLAFEAHQLRTAATPRLEADTFTVASTLDDQAVVLEYSAEWTEDHRGGNWLVCCQWVHIGGFKLDASPVAGPLKREVAQRFQAECNAHFDRQPAQRRVLGTVAVARAA